MIKSNDPSRKCTFSLRESALKDIDEISSEIGISKSGLVTLAVRDWISNYRLLKEKKKRKLKK